MVSAQSLCVHCLHRAMGALGTLAVATGLAANARAQTPEQVPIQPPTQSNSATQEPLQAPHVAAKRASPYPQQRVTDKAKKYYVGAWGVDKMKASYASSGNLIRFSYHVSDAELAKPLGSKDNQPVLVGLRSRAVLQIPVMDKVGPLRQATLPKAGQEYWMMFSNKGNLVRPGDRVNVIIGQFHADGLVVE